MIRNKVPSAETARPFCRDREANWDQLGNFLLGGREAPAGCVAAAARGGRQAVHSSLSRLADSTPLTVPEC